MENERLEIPKLYLEKLSLPTKICLKLTSRLKPACLSRVFTARRTNVNSFYTNFDLPMVYFPFGIPRYHYTPRTIQTNITDRDYINY